MRRHDERTGPDEDRETYYRELNAAIGARHGLSANQVHAIRSLWALHHDRMRIAEWAARNLGKEFRPRFRKADFYQQILNKAGGAFSDDWADLTQPDRYQEARGD